MKKIFYSQLFLLLIFFTSNVWGISAKCDPPPYHNVEYYILYKRAAGETDWTVHESNIAPEADGSINYDLATFPDGDWELTIEACNMRGCERAENPSFATLASSVNKPQNLKIAP